MEGGNGMGGGRLDSREGRRAGGRAVGVYTTLPVLRDLRLFPPL